MSNYKISFASEVYSFPLGTEPLYLEFLRSRLNLSPNQKDSLEIVALQDKSDKSHVNFELDTNLGLDLLCIPSNQLSQGAEYELLVKDLRDEAVNLLSEEDRTKIKNAFDAIDLNKDGLLETKEIVQYFTDICNQHMEQIERVAAKKIESSPKLKQRIERMRDISIKNEKQRRDRRIAQVKEADLDGNHLVDRDEFLRYEAMRVIRLNALKEKRNK